MNQLRTLRTYLSNSLEPLQEIQNLLQAQRDLILDIPNLWPLRGVRGWISMNFGGQSDPFTGEWYIHRGLDICCGYAGAPVVATAEGRISDVKYNSLGYGNVITIRHKYGFYTLYAHLQSIYVQKGQDVQRGQVIGTVGSTGWVTGPHLHYEVSIGSQVVDPLVFLNISSHLLTQAPGD